MTLYSTSQEAYHYFYFVGRKHVARSELAQLVQDAIANSVAPRFATGFTEIDLVGAHVQKAWKPEDGPFIALLCSSCNAKRGELLSIDERIWLPVPAIPSRKCG